MKLDEILNEQASTGATTAGSFAGFRDCLFNDQVKRAINVPKYDVEVIDFKNKLKKDSIPVISFDQED